MTKLSIINEGQNNNTLTFTEEMNTKCIKKLMYLDEISSLNSLVNIDMVSNLEQLHFTLTPEVQLSKINFELFTNL